MFSTAVSSSLTASAYTDISLNHEAKQWILSGSKGPLRNLNPSDRGYGFAVALLEWYFDYNDRAPSDDVEIAYLATTGTHPTFGPSSTLNGTWLTGSTGPEPKYTQYDFTIEPYNNDITQYPRRIPQTPYGLSIKGPSSLRGKNVPYKVTS